MICPYCQTENLSGNKFCAGCGAPINEDYNPSPNYKSQSEHQAVYNQNNVSYAQNGFYDKYRGHSMGWYKFLIYFALFAGAFINLIEGIRYLTGSIYGEYRDAVYIAYNNLQLLDIVFGLILMVLAVFIVFTRFRLAGLKRGAPSLLYAVYVLNALLQIAYFAAFYIINMNSLTRSLTGGAGLSQMISSTVSAVFVAVVMLTVNVAYFKKRKDLFVK